MQKEAKMKTNKQKPTTTKNNPPKTKQNQTKQKTKTRQGLEATCSRRVLFAPENMTVEAVLISL